MALEFLKNTYITLEDANKYFENRLSSEIWASTSEENKIKALVTATNRVDNNIFIGYKKDIAQPLEFPRIFSSLGFCRSVLPEVPKEIPMAVCEEAVSLLQFLETKGDEQFNTSEELVKSVKLGDASITYAESQTKSALHSSAVYSENAQRLLNKWIKKGFCFSKEKFTEFY